MAKSDRTLTNIVKKILFSFYMGLERPFRPNFWQRKKIDKKYEAITRTNNVVKKFYKRPELQILDLENLEFFNFKTEDGLTLRGLTYAPNKNSNKWLIACHWFAGHMYWALHHAKAFSEMGWNIMAFDFRGHNESEKSPTTAINEYKDLLAAIDWLKENKKIDELSLMGTSMGGFAVNYVAVRYSEMLKGLNLKFIVSDCTYTGIYTLFFHIKKIYLKFIRKRKAKKFIRKQISIQEKRSKDSGIENIEVIKEIDEGHIPMAPGLFFHSADDLVTSPLDTYDLLLKRSKYISGDEYKIYAYSMHTQAIRVHFKSYITKLVDFINKYSPDEDRYKKIYKEWDLFSSDEDRRDVKAKELE